MSDTKKIKLSFAISSGEEIDSEFSISDGDSAFVSYKQVAGNEQKTIEDFFDYIRGLIGKGVINITGGLDTGSEEELYRYITTNTSPVPVRLDPESGGLISDTITLIKRDGSIFATEDLQAIQNGMFGAADNIYFQFEDLTTENQTELKFTLMGQAINANLTGKAEIVDIIFCNFDYLGELGTYVVNGLAKFEILFEPDYQVELGFGDTIYRNHIVPLTGLKVGPLGDVKERPDLYFYPSTGNKQILDYAEILNIYPAGYFMRFDPPQLWGLTNKLFDPNVRYWGLHGMYPDGEDGHDFSTTVIKSRVIEGPESDCEFVFPTEVSQAIDSIDPSYSLSLKGLVKDKNGNGVPYVMVGGDFVSPSSDPESLQLPCSEPDGQIYATVSLQHILDDKEFFSMREVGITVGSLKETKIVVKHHNHFKLESFDYISKSKGGHGQTIYKVSMLLTPNPDYHIEVGPQTKFSSYQLTGASASSGGVPINEFSKPIIAELTLIPGAAIVATIKSIVIDSIDSGQNSELYIQVPLPPEDLPTV